jgi:predicted nucleic acid-binding protein
MTTVYLDACCLNRPFDDQTQDRIRLETEAVILILTHIETGEWEWIGSEALDFEIGQIPDQDRQVRVKLLTTDVRRSIRIEHVQSERAQHLAALGFHPYDALHLACAESGAADVFLTTDDRLLRLAGRMSGELNVSVRNPLPWLEEVTKR